MAEPIDGKKNNGDDKGKEGEVTLSKADHDALLEKSGKTEKLEGELEDMRLEVFSPEYTAFLESKDKGDDKGKEGDKKPDATDKTISDEDFEKMSKKDIFLKAKNEAKEEMKEELQKDRDDRTSASKADTQAEIARFARAHDDYETYRPIMYGLSRDKKNADMSLQELYDAAKTHVKAIHAEPTKEEKERQAKLGGEKPGGASESTDKGKKMSGEEAGKEAMAEVKEKLGPIPAA